jgi:ABC-type Fe3+/spermidine/putrescine transport system ATPase subunit
VSYLEIDDLRARYGDVTVLKGVSFAARQGERICLLGPSGCGKTTTLQVMAGFIRPDSGAVRVGGRDLSGLPPEKRDIGVMFQNYALFPHLTVRDNVAFGLRMRRLPEAEVRTRVADALRLVKLGHAAAKYPRALSGGEQQRIAFARAVVIQPRLLLLDEPFSNLDARLRQEMRAELLDLLQGLDIATVMVTHDQEEAMAIADRIALMRAGRIEQIGTATEIYEAPSSLFVARFVGESNVLAARVVSSDASGTQLEVPDIGGIAARARPGLKPGAAATVLVRPQRMVVLPAGAAPEAGWNRLPVEVERVMFLGHRTETHVRAGAHRLVVWQQSALAPTIVPGAAAIVAWPAADTLLVDDDA